LRLLPAEVHIGNLNREHIELLVAHSGELGKNISGKGMRHVRAMLEFMATNSAWKGPRPPRFLIYPEDIPRNTSTLPRPILPDVIEQFDAWLDKAVAAMQSNEAPPLLHPMLWDALLILRRTGMRTEDLCHLKQPDTNGKNGCLEQDSAGDWWIRIDAKNHKMGKDHRIPTKQSDGTVEAIRRQVQRVVGVENHLGDWLLFRDDRGSLRYSVVNGALRKLSAHLSHEGRPYKISPHQFRHTIATDMIEMGVDPYTVKEFLGHESLEMTQKYIKVYLSTLKKRYDEYRSKRPPSFAAVITDNLAHAEISFGAEDDSGWEEGRVGKLYRSPLPNGMGVCKHLPMLDPCPTPPVCGFCSKLCVEKRHLPVWETALENHLWTKEILAQNSTANAKALERHTPYLEKARHIVETVRREGFYDGRIHNK
jgi:integrase